MIINNKTEHNMVIFILMYRSNDRLGSKATFRRIKWSTDTLREDQDTEKACNYARVFKCMRKLELPVLQQCSV